MRIKLATTIKLAALAAAGALLLSACSGGDAATPTSDPVTEEPPAASSGVADQINLIAFIPANEGSAEQVHDLLVEYGEHVLTMDGAERFEVFSNQDDPNQLIVVERYRDQQAFDEHLADPENEVLNTAMADLTDGGSQLTFLVRK